MISKLGTGLLIQKDATEIIVDQAAVGGALGIIIAALTDGGRALGAARKAGYDAGLAVGREQQKIEDETALRIADRQAEDLAQALVTGGLASAA